MDRHLRSGRDDCRAHIVLNNVTTTRLSKFSVVHAPAVDLGANAAPVLGASTRGHAYGGISEGDADATTDATVAPPARLRAGPPLPLLPRYPPSPATVPT